jgi:DNA-binding winged helix-turn-helix (wHTH) protein/tetratricopeptide (TPR) repeat protein
MKVEHRSVYRVGAVQYDEARQEVLVDGQRRSLEAKPLALLQALLVRAGTLATKRELIAAVWGNPDHISEASLATAMSKLRAALGDKGRDLIEVVHGSGYRIAQPVEVTAACETPLAFGFKAGDAVPGRPQWRLERLLGAAPLNDVWLARHEKTGEQRVFKFADSEARLQTLRREATLSRVLQATLGTRFDLIRIVEWNFDERPYFIESAYGGEDLPGWAAAQGGLDAVKLAVRLALMARVARAIAAAHGAGVLHGDIKPANILVSYDAGSDDRGEPIPRLADFGAGGLSDGVRLDAMAISGLEGGSGERGTGTLRYMAPEVLAGGAPTTAADIYGLGVLLYQLVTGDLTRSLSVGWEADIADDLLRQDIAAAAAGDPARRLDSAALLAERLETLPARRTQMAREAQAAARADALARAVERDRLRRPWILAAALSMAAGLALSTVFGIRAVHDRDEARRRAAIAQAVNSFLTEDLFGRGNPARSGKADESLMDAAQAAEAGIGRRLAGEPLVEGSIYLSLARAFDSRSAYDAARHAYDEAIGAFQNAGEAGHAEAVITRLHEAQMEVASGEPGSLARARGIIGEAGPLVATLGKRRPEAQVWLESGTAMLQMLGGDVRAAQEGYRAAAERADAMPEVFDENVRLSLHQRLAFTYMRLGDFAGALPQIQSLLERRLALSGPRHPATLQLELNLAQIRIATGQFDMALQDLNRIYPVFAEVYGQDHVMTMTLLGTRAQALSQLERYDAAAADEMTIHRLQVAKQGDHSWVALGTLTDAAQDSCRGGKAAEGLQMARTAYDGARAAFGPASGLAQSAGMNVAFCLIMAGQFAPARPLLDAIDLPAVSQLMMDPDVGADIELMRAAIAFGTGDAAAGRALVAKAAPVFQKAGGDRFMRRWAASLR